MVLESVHDLHRIEHVAITDWPEIRFCVEIGELEQALHALASKHSYDWQLELEIRSQDGVFVPVGSLVRLMSKLGVAGVTISLTLDPGRPRETVQSLEFLRECAAQCIQVRWSVQGSVPKNWRRLVHLAPPQWTTGGSRSRAKEWARLHRHEALTFRKGPKFILVQDLRDDDNQFTACLDTAESIAAFTGTLLPVTLAELKGRYGKEVYREIHGMEGYGILFRAGDWIVNLAHGANRSRIPYK